jgi:hypothetical protein
VRAPRVARLPCRRAVHSSPAGTGAQLHTTPHAAPRPLLTVACASAAAVESCVRPAAAAARCSSDTRAAASASARDAAASAAAAALACASMRASSDAVSARAATSCAQVGVRARRSGSSGGGGEAHTCERRSCVARTASAPASAAAATHDVLARAAMERGVRARTRLGCRLACSKARLQIANRCVLGGQLCAAQWRARDRTRASAPRRHIIITGAGARRGRRQLVAPRLRLQEVALCLRARRVCGG